MAAPNTPEGRRDQARSEITALAGMAFAALIVFTALCMFGCPAYNVWHQGMEGRAELARANANRQIKVAEATAAEEAALKYAAADTIRAHGEARANYIMGSSLTGEAGERRLRYLFIQGLGDNGRAPTVIYVPTEAGLPITEASRSWGMLEPQRAEVQR